LPARAAGWFSTTYAHQCFEARGTLYGEAGLTQSVEEVNERWHFGLEPEQVGPFLSAYGFTLSDHKDACDLEKLYFKDANRLIVGRVNGTHCLVTAEVP